MRKTWMRAILAATAAAFYCLPANAQKSKDTLRLGVHQPISIIDAIFDPHPQTNLMDRMVYDTLVNYDSDKRTVVPGLAESWTMIDPKTIEMRLRRGVTFHDGSEFDADDAVYSVNFVIDPNVRFRFKETRYGEIESIEKIDKYTIRLRTKNVHAPLLTRLIPGVPMLPSDAHGKAPDKSLFGRAPIGTGPYRVTQLDSTRGAIFLANPSYKHGSAAKPAASIGRIEVIPVPDEQTRVAKLMVGELDLIYDVPRDVAENLKANPAIGISVRPSVSFVYLAMDAAGRSGFKPFMDKRVREAMIRGIDRKAIARALTPKEISDMPLQSSMCHPWHIGCASSNEPPSYDPQAARKLLADAGYPNGFAVTIGTWGAARYAAEAAAGQLRQIGINASLENLSVGAFVKRRAGGQLQAYMVLWDNGGGNPDVDSTSGFFFERGDRNYNHDEELIGLHAQGRAEMDTGKREVIYRRIFDKANTERYLAPIMPLPSILAHSKDVEIPVSGTKKPEGFMFNLLKWK